MRGFEDEENDGHVGRNERWKKEGYMYVDEDGLGKGNGKV